MPPCASKFMDPECHKCTLGRVLEPLKWNGLGLGGGWGVKELLCCCFYRFRGRCDDFFWNGMGKEN